MTQIFALDDECNMNIYNWQMFKFFITELKDITMSTFATKIYNSILNSHNPIYLVKTSTEYHKYISSNFHGGCNDKLLTRHEMIFKSMFPNLIPQKVFGTGIGGYKKYMAKRYIADFFDEHKKIIIEIDGENHKKQLISLKDKIRNNFFYDNGYQVIRFTNQDVLLILKLYCSMIDITLHKNGE